MGARQRLNSIYAAGCLAVAATVGLVAQSWGIFFLALAVAIGLSVHAGDIRPRPDDRHRRPGR
jgi:hypothetical protein